MKIPLPLAVFLLFAGSLQAQIQQFNFQDRHLNEILGVRSDAGGSLYVATLSDKIDGIPNVVVRRLGAQLQESAHIPLWPLGVLFSFDFLPVSGGVVYVGSAFQCDIGVLPSVYFSNDQGEIGYSDILPDPGWDLNSPLGLLPGISNTFWVLQKGRRPLHYHLGGILLDSAAFVLEPARGYISLPNGRFLLYGDDGIRIVKNDLSTLTQAFTGEQILGADTLSQGRIVLAAADRLLILDGILNVLQEKPHAYSVLDMRSDAQGIWLLTGHPDRRLQRYDEQLNLQEEWLIGADAPFQPRFLTRSEGALILAGEQRKQETDYQVVALRTLDNQTPNFSSGADAGLSNLVSKQAGQAVNFPQTPVYYIRFDSVFVTLHNYGADLLDEATINGFFGIFYPNCSQVYVYKRTFTDLQLPPGGSQEIYLEVFNTEYALGVPSQYQLCFWTTLPNGLLDTDAGNNSTCLNVPVLVSSSEAMAVEPVGIFPNPATDRVRLEWEKQGAGPAWVRIFDQTGRQVHESREETGVCSVQVDHWPPGLYTVEIAAGGKRYGGVLVVQ
jgi:hypothetical protein